MSSAVKNAALAHAPGTAGNGMPGFVALAGWIGGAALQLQQAVLWPLQGYVVGMLAGFALWVAIRGLRNRSASLAMALALIAGLLVGAGSTGWRAALYDANTLDPVLEGRDLRVSGVVSQMPQPGEAGIRFRFDIESARWATADTTPMPAVPPRITLGWYAENTGLWGNAPASPVNGSALPSLHAGERWQLTVRLKAPHGNLNPHGFDYELWLWEQGVQATGYVRTGSRDAAPVVVTATWRHPVERARESVRRAVFEYVPDRKEAGVLAALITGDQGAIERADWDIFRATGVAHLMSISGLHITLFAWVAAWCIGTLWRRSQRLMLRCSAQHAALVGGVALAALYALFSGWGVPSQRTIWMLAAVALLRLSGRRWPWPFVWLLACAVVVVADPWALLQAGFWLSFVAVGVLFATNSIADSAGRTGAGGRLKQFFREQWTITLALTPLTLLLFQQVSVVGLLANAIAIPLVTLVITPLALLGVVVHPLWAGAAQAVAALGALLQFLAGLPFATWSMAAPPGWLAACGVAGGVLLAMRLPWNLRCLGVPLLLPVLLWQTPRPPAGEFSLLAADVGQGNAVLVRTASHSLLYDTGPRYSLESDAGHRVLVPLLRAFDEPLDLLLLSHRDSDHTGGAATVLAMQPRAALLSSIEATHPLMALRPGQRCVAGQHWEWDGVSFDILHPLAPDEASEAAPPKPNAVSCVLRISTDRVTALLAGDIEREQEAALLQRNPPAKLAADWLLVPHHGSKTSSSAAWLDTVQPSIAVAQAGYRNRFGHPAAEVRARYEARGVRLLDSPSCGAALWESRAPNEAQCERQTAARYWNHRLP